MKYKQAGPTQDESRIPLVPLWRNKLHKQDGADLPDNRHKELVDRNNVSSLYGAAYRASETFKVTEHFTIPRTAILLL